MNTDYEDFQNANAIALRKIRKIYPEYLFTSFVNPSTIAGKSFVYVGVIHNKEPAEAEKDLQIIADKYKEILGNLSLEMDMLGLESFKVVAAYFRDFHKSGESGKARTIRLVRTIEESPQFKTELIEFIEDFSQNRDFREAQNVQRIVSDAILTLKQKYIANSNGKSD